MSDIDEATGLAALPDGMFWRVLPNHGFYSRTHALRLEMRKKFLWGSILVDWHFVTNNTASDLRWSASYYAPRYFPRTIDDSLLGDYPPKKLEA